MTGYTGFLDRLPAPVRHALIAAGGAAILVVVQAILGASGVTGIADWPTVAKAALDAAAVAVAGLLPVAVLASTKATRQYGAGSGGADGIGAE